MWSIENQTGLPKSDGGQKLNFLIMLPIFFYFFEIGVTGKAGESYVQLFVAELLYKFQPKRSIERKVMPVLWKVSQPMLSERHNSAGKTAAARAKLPWYLQ